MNLKEEAANTNWVALVLLVVITGLLSFGIYWWQKQTTVDTTPIEITPTPTQTVKPTATTTPTVTPTPTDETAGWKTFTNDTYDFSIKYPKDWVYKDDYETSVLFVAFGSDKKHLPPPNTDASAGISIRVQEKMKDSERTTDTSKIKKEKITINGTKANKITLLPGRRDDFMGERKIVSVEITLDSGKILVLENVEDYEQYVFNKMLSTFEFTK